MDDEHTLTQMHTHTFSHTYSHSQVHVKTNENTSVLTCAGTHTRMLTCVHS
uniref:Uncharacterized protein n=1 Tax=Anguilla anguilla TaxID=7936 RepID=A0A0E9QXI1_ANGAN